MTMAQHARPSAAISMPVVIIGLVGVVVVLAIIIILLVLRVASG